jgi:hypothetical protein
LDLKQSILKTLVYYDLFKYPLTADEIRLFLDRSASEKEVQHALLELQHEQRVFLLENFYSIQNETSLKERRKSGNAKAEMMLEKAAAISRKLFKFPYVRAIGICGSLSKNFADDYADIDYFVITKANRLWIARTIMHLYKKLPFLKGKDKWYCMNYFVDEAILQIEEQNIYTATELVTVKPMYGNGSMKNFFDANDWALRYFPNQSAPSSDNQSKPSSWMKKVIETLFNNRFGDWLDNYFFRLTTKRWKLKEDQRRLNTKGELMGLKTSKHCSKPNPIHFHNWLLERYEKKMRELGLPLS